VSRPHARPRGPGGRLRALGLATLLALAAGCAHGPRPVAPPEGVDLRASLWLPSVGAVPYAPQELAGKVVLVNFFATWCFPCLQEVPALRSLQERYAARGFTVVAVGMDLDGARVLAPYAEAYAPPYPVLVASQELIEGRSPFGRILELPTSVLLDGQGRVLGAWTGLAPPERVAALIEAALPR
jgi:thiol-disulfide isomerase/thioredoxin